MPRTQLSDILNDYIFPDDASKVRLSLSVAGKLTTLQTTSIEHFNDAVLTSLSAGSYQIACLDGSGKMLKGSKMFQVTDNSDKTGESKALSEALRTFVSSESRNVLAILKEYSSIVNQHTKAFPKALDAMSKVVTDTRSREDALQDIIRGKDLEITELKRDNESGKWDSLNNVIEAIKDSKSADISNFAKQINEAPKGLLVKGLNNLKDKLNPDRLKTLNVVFGNNNGRVSLQELTVDNVTEAYANTERHQRLMFAELLVTEAFKVEPLLALPIAEKVYAIVQGMENE